jgi:hypothetical protein
MTFPGAETMKAGIIGEDCFRFMLDRGSCVMPLVVPLRCACSRLWRKSSILWGISEVGEDDDVLQVGVEMAKSMELDFEEVLLCLVPGSGSLLASLLVISQLACCGNG